MSAIYDVRAPKQSKSTVNIMTRALLEHYDDQSVFTVLNSPVELWEAFILSLDEKDTESEDTKSRL